MSEGLVEVLKKDILAATKAASNSGRCANRINGGQLYGSV